MTTEVQRLTKLRDEYVSAVQCLLEHDAKPMMFTPSEERAIRNRVQSAEAAFFVFAEASMPAFLSRVIGQQRALDQAIALLPCLALM